MTTSNTSSKTGPRSSSKALSKVKPASKKKVMVTVWWSAAGLIHYSFLSLSKTTVSEKYAQQIDEIHRKLQCWLQALQFSVYLSKLMRYTENCNACSQHWSTQRAQFSTTTPNHTLHNQHLGS